MNNAVHWRVMNVGLPCNLTRGLMHFNAPLWLRTKSFLLFHVSAAAPSVVVPSLLLVPQSGIHCLTICATRLLEINFDGLWKPTCLPVVDCALEVFFNVFALYKCTFACLLTYLLTYLLTFTVSTFSTVRALWRRLRPLPGCLPIVAMFLSFFNR